MDFLRGAPSYTYIRDPVRRLCHWLISYSISQRGRHLKRGQNDWAWVALGPERQPDVGAGTLEIAKGAPYVDEGDQAVLAPVQAPQPPPPPTVGRTIPQRLGRLKEETYQAFDGTFQGSSPAVFERRTRQRTGDASTSAATQQQDP
nr:hypothetical protein [Tanacetum cinerariifolium]GEZ88897.1 hypothetical protein [Tanacetum cinerariifolium]